MSTDDSLLFVPAATSDEAVARIFSLTGSQDPGTRGPKRALTALATALGIDVDHAATNAIVGGQIAREFDISWNDPRDVDRLKITLTGLNRLLQSATSYLWDLSQRSSIGLASYDVVLQAFSGFREAAGKQEAVDRLSDLSGVPRDALGPGGKEHRITFEAVAARAAPDLLDKGSGTSTKHTLVARLCERFGVPWLGTAGSTGQSVTFEGLNVLLAGYERFLSVTSDSWATPQEEGLALVSALRDGLPTSWDGRKTVGTMRDAGSRQWRQTEWPGFFFEERVGAILNNKYPTPPIGGPRRAYGNTVFDYASSTRVWDAKAHTSAQIFTPGGQPAQKMAGGPAILNDARAMTECVREQGLGFLILDGTATFDGSGEFDAWHREFTQQGAKPRRTSSNSSYQRRRKAAFNPIALRALWIADEASLNAGLAGGWLSRSKMGAQPRSESQVRGAARNEKFLLKINKAAPWFVAREEW